MSDLRLQGNSQTVLVRHIEHLIALKKAKDELAATEKEVFAVLKAEGFDASAVKILRDIAIRNRFAEHDEKQAILENYIAAYREKTERA